MPGVKPGSRGAVSVVFRICSKPRVDLSDQKLNEDMSGNYDGGLSVGGLSGGGLSGGGRGR